MVLVYQNSLYRIIIDAATINIIDSDGSPVADKLLIIELLKQVKAGD